MSMDTPPRDTWGSKLAFIFAAAGSAMASATSGASLMGRRYPNAS